MNRSEDPRVDADTQLAVHELGGEPLCAYSNQAVRSIVNDPATFSSAVSRHLQIPNGLDGEEHARFRTLIDAYLAPEVVAPLESRFQKVAADVLEALPPSEAIDAVMEIGAPFAVKAMIAWLGWPVSMAPQLVQWVKDNQKATRSQDPKQTAEIARRYDEMIRAVITPLMEHPDQTVTSQLVHDRSAGRELEPPEIVSILRNWTAGDLGSMAACIAVVLEGLSDQPHLQEHLAKGASQREWDAIINEFLRIDDPFVSNRRVATRDVEVAGVRIRKGQQLRVHWTAANRDPQAFEVDEFRPEEHASNNVVWGEGPHACPGRALSLLEIRVCVQELLSRYRVRRTHGRDERERYPVGGWRRLEVELLPLGASVV
ncbi:cytochrome P450 [Corynebacterium gerontici]|uniref:Cytochrome P450(BM-1) n=1 Tax=Corynebacterium gerontici TaxID=2079234 RepID=A0A3G6IYH2_9CORY|nr:cytochrome P450 [Corynebacterium gerontici]AZA10752.1 Cytochrome P450(BM-1) [Corynebacterium gerontici]